MRSRSFTIEVEKSLVEDFADVMPTSAREGLVRCIDRVVLVVVREDAVLKGRAAVVVVDHCLEVEQGLVVKVFVKPTLKVLAAY